MKRLILASVIALLLVGCADKASIHPKSQTTESSLAVIEASISDKNPPEIISQTEDINPNTKNSDTVQTNAEKLEKQPQDTQKNNIAIKSKQTTSQPLISPSQSGVTVNYQQVTEGHVGPLVIKNFPQGKFHKVENLNISWQAQGAVGYSFFWRAGNLGGSDEGNINDRTSFLIAGSSIAEGTKIELQIYAAGSEGLKLNSSLWLGDFIMLTLLPPTITNLKNDTIVDKENVALNWTSAFDSKPLPFFTKDDYIIKVKDLGNNQDIFSTNLHEEYSKLRSFTFPNTVFVSGHKYMISLEEQVHYQDYVSDQGPMLSRVIINVK